MWMMRPHLRFHAWHHGAGQGHHGSEIHLDVSVPHFVGDFLDGLRIVDAGVVDEDVDLAESLLCFHGQRLHGCTVGQVGHHPFDFDVQSRADFSRSGGEFLGIAAGDEDIRASFSEATGHGFAKTFAAAGDECCFAREIEKWGGHARGLACVHALREWKAMGSVLGSTMDTPVRRSARDDLHRLTSAAAPGFGVT